MVLEEVIEESNPPKRGPIIKPSEEERVMNPIFLIFIFWFLLISINADRAIASVPQNKPKRARPAIKSVIWQDSTPKPDNKKLHVPPNKPMINVFFLP